MRTSIKQLILHEEHKQAKAKLNLNKVYVYILFWKQNKNIRFDISKANDMDIDSANDERMN